MTAQAKQRSAHLDDRLATCVSVEFTDAVALATRYVIRPRNWYRRRARNVRRLFRLFGVGVIVMSASLPIVAAIDFADSQVAITTLSVGVAGLTALRAFFHWDDQWRAAKTADWKLTSLLAQWEADLSGIESPSSDEAKQRAQTLTKALLAAAADVIGTESTSFFSAVTWPQEQANGAARPAPDMQGARQLQRGA
jgi:hypothetical protein